MKKGTSKYSEEILNLILTSDKTSKELSVITGVPYNTIKSYRNKFSYKKPSVDILTPELKDVIYNEVLKGASFTYLGEKYGVCRKKISKFLKEEYNFVVKTGNKFTQEEEMAIYEEAKNNTSSQLAIKYGCSKSLIDKIFLKYKDYEGKKVYDYEKFFETINSDCQAYWLGFIAADGCVYKRENGNYILSISLQKKDSYMLNKFTDSMCKCKATDVYFYENSASLQVGSKKMCLDLEKYNIVPRKTWTYKPVDLHDDRLMFSFIRGYFDGDGSIKEKNEECLPSSYEVEICGNYETMIYFHEFLLKYNIFSSVVKDSREGKYTHDFYTLLINNNPSKYLFLRYIYQDSCELYLKRKYERASRFIKKFEENPRQYKKYYEAIEEYINCPLFK